MGSSLARKEPLLESDVRVALSVLSWGLLGIEEFGALPP